MLGRCQRIFRLTSAGWALWVTGRWLDLYHLASGDTSPIAALRTTAPTLAGDGLLLGLVNSTAVLFLRAACVVDRCPGECRGEKRKAVYSETGPALTAEPSHGLAIGAV